MNKQVNKDEVRAKKYLQTLEYKEVVYEPLGNVTPDFLLDNKIAVEVRRLNRNYINSEQSLSVENFEIPLVKNIKKIINIFESQAFTSSAYVSVTISKPLNIDSKTKVIKKIKKILKSHTRQVSVSKSYQISDYLKLTFTPTGKKQTQYIFSACNENSSWIIDELQKNLQLVINEKNKKIENNFKLYSEWWLVLVDSIIYGLDSEDFEKLQKIKLQKYRFSKVIILSPKGDFKAFEF